MNESIRIWHPFTQSGLDPDPVRIVSGEGVYLHTADGRRLIDGISSWWVNLHGHGHPHIARAVRRQAEKLEHVIFAGFTHEPAEHLAEKLSRIVPAGLDHVFFSDNGSTAVEVAVKMAVQYWRNLGETGRHRIVALENAFHGDTAGAMSVSGDSVFTEAFPTLRFPVLRAHSPYCHRCPVGKTWDDCAIDCLDSFEAMLESEGTTIAACIVEPLVQGGAGMIVQPPGYLERIGTLCRRHGVLLIADEVLTGFGRTGTMFACERAGVTPDLMCISKGLTGGFLPFAATLASSAVHDAFRSTDRMHTFFHGHSYSGNPLGCAAAIANLEIFENEPVFERIRSIERVHAERLPLLAAQDAVGDIRMIGTIAAVELDVPDTGYLSAIRPRLYRYFLDHGVLLRPLGNVIYILPPYVISEDELHRVYDVVTSGIAEATIKSGV
jgi:adenosylmethionine-8-amino-7-oxononanoate aminotransferase